ASRTSSSVVGGSKLWSTRMLRHMRVRILAVASRAMTDSRTMTPALANVTAVTVELTTEQARRMRWRAQLLGGSSFTPAGVVRRAVALQGQDLPAVLRAIAIRSKDGTTLSDVRAAFDSGELVRSWPMRG